MTSSTPPAGDGAAAPATFAPSTALRSEQLPSTAVLSAVVVTGIVPAEAGAASPRAISAAVPARRSPFIARHYAGRGTATTMGPRAPRSAVWRWWRDRRVKRLLRQGAG